jgi:hypothetical protein
LALLAATFGLVAGCGETDDGAAQGNDAGSAGQAVGGAGGAANAGKSGGASAGSSAGTTLGGVSGSGSGGSSASAGTAAGASAAAGAPVEAGAPSGGASGPLHDCDPRKVTCKIAVPDCPDLQVPSVEGTCWGDCVGIAECACSEAEDCPDNDQYTCWSQQHCGPYVR